MVYIPSSSCVVSTDLPASLFVPPSLSSIAPDYILCPHWALVGKFVSVSQHWHVYVKGSIGECHLWGHSCFSSSSSNISCLSCMVSVMGGKWPYNCFVGCCFNDLFTIACTILVQFPSSFFTWCTHTVVLT